MQVAGAPPFGTILRSADCPVDQTSIASLNNKKAGVIGYISI